MDKLFLHRFCKEIVLANMKGMDLIFEILEKLSGRILFVLDLEHAALMLCSHTQLLYIAELITDNLHDLFVQNSLEFLCTFIHLRSRNLNHK